MAELKIVNNNQSLKDQAIEVLDFLNLKTGKRFRSVKVNLDFIQARLKSGLSVQDLKSIITMKTRQCESGDFDKLYLRPQTLFNETKCESYYGQLE
ncbi:MAG: conserved phage C-terminal domain-containing protein [Candidatus Scalindua sp.]